LLTGVVGGESEIPVAELRVQIAKIASGSPGGFHYVQAVISPWADLKAVPARGLRHELPEPERPLGGQGCSTAAALDQYESNYIQWNPFLP
jgi:hypothetical protein